MSTQLPINTAAEEGEGLRHKSWLAFLLSRDYAMGMDSASVGGLPFSEGKKEYAALLAEVESWKSKAQKWEKDWGAARAKIFKMDAKIVSLEEEIERLKKGTK